MLSHSAIPSLETAAESLPRYDWRQPYDWNFDHAPDAVSLEVPSVPGRWDYCGLPVGSPLAIAAGPLLNGRWILYYASLGFDVLTYKTVRSAARASYPMPNLQPVSATSIHGDNRPLHAMDAMNGSWAVSFGMPSKSPDFWRRDIEETRKRLPKHKVLAVSVVASPESHGSIDELAEDFALCARWAVESGADCVEANFSCPNVQSCDGQLYQLPNQAADVAARLRKAIGRVPLLIKTGHVTSRAEAAALIDALTPHVNALVMVNCIPARITDATGKPLFDGEKRGVAGQAIRSASLDQVKLFGDVIREKNVAVRIVGGGGIATAADVQAHLGAGAHAVQLATAAMLDPFAGLRIRRELATTNEHE